MIVNKYLRRFTWEVFAMLAIALLPSYAHAEHEGKCQILLLGEKHCYELVLHAHGACDEDGRAVFEARQQGPLHHNLAPQL